MNKVIITGCAGFIGSNLASLMLQEGYTVMGIDNFHSYYSKEIKKERLKTLRGFSKFNFVKSDITNLDLKDFIDFKWDVCIHLAGTPGVLHSVKFPEEYESNNVKATKSLLTFLNKIGVKKLIFSSSSSLYNENQHQFFNESKTDIAPRSPYGKSKEKCEKIIKNWSLVNDTDAIILRLFSVYGPGIRPDLALLKFTRALNKNETITIYGDGKSYRDYTFINDIVNGINAATEYISKKHEVFEIINLGNGRPVQLNSMIEMIETKLHKTAKKIFTPSNQNEMSYTGADISVAKDILDYEPQYKFEEGINLFLEWYIENKSIYER